MDYRILGPLEAFDGERAISLGGARQRAVLALLVLHGNETLTSDVIVDELWGEQAPPTAVKVLQNCVSALRKELPPETIRTVAGAYSLTLEPEELDRDRFERLLAEGRAALAAGDHVDAAEQLRSALELWRGAPLSDFAYEAFAKEEMFDSRSCTSGRGRTDRGGARARPPRRARAGARVTRDATSAARAAALAAHAGSLSRGPAGRSARGLPRGAAHAPRRARDRAGRALHELERAILAQDPGLEAARRQTSPARGRAVRRRHLWPAATSSSRSSGPGSTTRWPAADGSS